MAGGGASNADAADDAIDEAFSALPAYPPPVPVEDFFLLCATEAARAGSPRDNVISALDAMSLVARAHVQALSPACWDASAAALGPRIAAAAARASAVTQVGDAATSATTPAAPERGTLRGGARTDAADAFKSAEVREEDDATATEAAAVAASLAVSLPPHCGSIRAALVCESVRCALCVAGARGSLPPRVRAARAAATLSIRTNDAAVIANLITYLVVALEGETRFPSVRAELLSALAVAASSAAEVVNWGESSALSVAITLAVGAVNRAQVAPGATARVADAAREALFLLMQLNQRK